MRASLARARGRCVDSTSYAGPTKPIYAPQACSGRTSIACSPVLRTARAGGDTPWLAMKRAAASMLLVRHSTWKGPGPRRPSAWGARPPSSPRVSRGRAAAALGGVADLDPAPAHRRHVGRQVVALHDDVAEAAAAGQELGEASVGASGDDGVPVAQAQQLEIVLLVEGDGVVGRPAGVGAAGIDVEADPRIRGDARVQVRDADHDVVDAGQHADSSMAATRGGRAGASSRRPRS